ncbi:MAG: type I methionyl aminopeptidase, partial [Firmicutes bacterium]|nr:type I methionyl aminopeptidase [Bacillota bacterium]
VAGIIVAQVLQRMSEIIEPGITTGQLDRESERLIRKNGAEPAFLGYHGFPASICTSINEEVVHGIPGLRRLKEGDIISIDVGAKFKGYYGDAAATFAVGEIDERVQKLIDVTRESLQRGISMVRVGGHLTDISHAIQSYAEKHGFSVVRNYVGHGIGSAMHEEPQVPNFGAPGRGPRLENGMVLAIEPMINAGTWEVKTLLDQWTVVTKDGQLSAHFEHTVAIIDDTPEILTVL